MRLNTDGEKPFPTQSMVMVRNDIKVENGERLEFFSLKEAIN